MQSHMHCKWHCRLEPTNAFAQITTKSHDFNSYIIETRDSAIIKFDPLLVANLRKNNPAEWEFLNGPIRGKQPLRGKQTNIMFMGFYENAM
jgi:hypothetical protein